MKKTRTIVDAPESYIVLDTETTGLSSKYCDLIEFGGHKVIDGEIVESFDTLLKPSHLPINPFITDLTGITTDMLADAPNPKEAIPNIFNFVQGYPIVGHCICFDMDFLNKAFDSQGFEFIEPELIDTKRLSRLTLSKLETYSLDAITEACRTINDDFQEMRGAHRSLKDASITRYCFETMRPLLHEKYGSDIPAGFKTELAKKDNLNCADYIPTVDEIDVSNPFYDTVICFTGTLSAMTRAEAFQKAVNLGATPVKNYKNSINYLVVGHREFSDSLNGKKTSKFSKAEKAIENGLDLKIISEDLYLEYASGV